MNYVNTTHQTVAWLKKANDDGLLVMKAPFQRNPVWSVQQKRFLIDSIIHSFPVPEIYMQSHLNEEGQSTHIVVDGQQRVRACLEYLEGGFELDDQHCYDFVGMAFDDLPSEIRRAILTYNFVVRTLPESNEEELRSIFTRLNQNVVALNQQELRHATYWGPFIKLMEKVAEDAVWAKTGIFTANDVRRMLDVEYISELAIAAVHGPQDKKNTLAKWYEIYEANFDSQAYLTKVFGRVPHEILAVLPHISDTRWSKRSDYYSLFLTFVHYHESLPMSADARAALGDRLLTFGLAVDKWLADPASASAPKNVATYAAAVQRAATDHANRKARGEALLNVVRKLFPAAP